MRELISRITVSASGRLTEPLKWTLLGGTAILSDPRSRLRLRSQHAVRELSDAASVNTTPACSMHAPLRFASPRLSGARAASAGYCAVAVRCAAGRSEEHTSELQSPDH